MKQKPVKYNYFAVAYPGQETVCISQSISCIPVSCEAQALDYITIWRKQWPNRRYVVRREVEVEE